MPDSRILPLQLVQTVDQFIDHELEMLRAHDNLKPFDPAATFNLHRLAAQIYAAGWEDGERAALERANNERRRERERTAAG